MKSVMLTEKITYYDVVNNVTSKLMIDNNNRIN